MLQALRNLRQNGLASIEQLQHDLAAVIADLEATVGVDPNVIARFDRLSKEVRIELEV